MQIKQITLTIQKDKVLLNKLRSLPHTFGLLMNKITDLGNFDSLLNSVKKIGGRQRLEGSSVSFANKSGFPKRRVSKAAIKFLVILLTLGILVGFLRVLRNATRSEDSTENVEVKSAKASQDLTREFEFPIRDNDGEEVSKIKFVLEKAELMDEIIVKGQRATSVKGRIFF